MLKNEITNVLKAYKEGRISNFEAVGKMAMLRNSMVNFPTKEIELREKMQMRLGELRLDILMNGKDGFFANNAWYYNQYVEAKKEYKEYREYIKAL